MCNCRQVSHAEIARLAEEGRSLGEIMRETGASIVCGQCGISVIEIAGAATMHDAVLVEKEDLDSRHIRYLFHSDASAEKTDPGSAIVIELAAKDRKLLRTYTVTGGDHQSGLWEIMIRTEPHGVVSRWLAEFADTTTRLRISPPISGDADGLKTQLNFIAGGIGITPAISRLKALANVPNAKAWVHWSARFEKDSQLSERIAGLVRDVPGGKLTMHDTRTGTRMREDDWAAVIPSPEDTPGDMYVCGPVQFMEDVGDVLTLKGWPPERVHVDHFYSPAQMRAGNGGVRFDYAPDAIVAEGFHLQPARSVHAEAHAFLLQFYFEHGSEMSLAKKLGEVAGEIRRTGTYTQTSSELKHGAKIAWRNSTRCIGRYFWQTLTVRDMRHLEDEAHIFEALLDHLRFSSNGGDLRAAVTVFRPGEPRIRILNKQLLLYAGYPQQDGTVVGDPKNVGCDYLRAIARLARARDRVQSAAADDPDRRQHASPLRDTQRGRSRGGDRVS